MKPLFLSASLTTLFLAMPAFAQGTTQETQEKTEPHRDEIFVWGRDIDLIGEAGAASEGVVGYDDFSTRPLSRPGELVEVIPGMIATQHSGTGKANQYFLRGFNLDHGTDFSASVDGVPVNMRTHGHGQGYLDLNFIIPEIIERVEYSKGPYFADKGDFSAAGSAAFSTYDVLPQNFAELQLGEFGFVRGVGGASYDLGGKDLTLAAEIETYEGPWVKDENLEKINLLAKLGWGSPSAAYEITLMGYDASWDSTDQIPSRAVESGMIDQLGFLEPDAGGSTSRYGITGAAEWAHDGNRTTNANLYALSYDLELFSNFTYFLDDPVNGDEFEQLDERTVYGGSIEHAIPTRLGDMPVTVRLGAQTRYDDIGDVGLFRTAMRERLSTVRRDSVEEMSAALYGEAEIQLTPRLRAIGGLRGDYYDVSVDARSEPQNSGDADDSLFSPSIALAWRATDVLELYANYGEGFHSNDARGATISVDPNDGMAVDPVQLLVPAQGSEIGARFENGPIKATLVFFQLDLDSELVFVGDAGTTEPNGATERTGVEATLFWEATDWLVFDASAAYTDASYRDEPGDADEIPGAVESVIGGGAVATWGDLTASLRVRHFGEAPLTEDGSVTSDATTLVNLGTSYDFGRVSVGLDILNLFDSEDNDITYFYESQLAGEASPVADIHYHPVEPRQARLVLKTSF
ncbi:TonB-dependent receptor [Parvularcula flava]|uniref:TonB-dependent receptor n=1 Tax=Aquisalinus luteolus TaxID=1566827 RepID=A0A8J3A735_9PROT|nr:TonB-dependent receptor [Aquisalinus luteolus]NHK27777.1 TonB-dependent receptor [Aquisalinus luteolus]GGH96468.1 TonB-dependent receptor [Aquisalinus luteolus]